MEHGAALGAGEGLERARRRRCRCPGSILAGHQAAERRLRCRSRAAGAGPRPAPCVARVGEVAGTDARQGQRVGGRRSRPCRAIPAGTAHAEAEKPEKRCSGSPGLSTDSGMTLNSTSARPPSACCGRDAAPPTWPAPTVSGPRCANSHCAPHPRQAQRIAHVVVERALLLQPDDDARLVVVLQVARRPRAHRRRPDAVALQQLRRADARELQQLRRLQRAGGEEHFAVGAALPALAGLDPLDAAGATVLDHDARHLRAGHDREVRPVPRRREEGGGGVAAPAPAQRELVAAEAVVDGAVEVGGEREPGLGAGREPGLAIRMVVAQVGDAELAAAPWYSLSPPS